MTDPPIGASDAFGLAPNEWERKNPTGVEATWHSNDEAKNRLAADQSARRAQLGRELGYPPPPPHWPSAELDTWYPPLDELEAQADRKKEQEEQAAIDAQAAWGPYDVVWHQYIEGKWWPTTLQAIIEQHAGDAAWERVVPPSLQAPGAVSGQTPPDGQFVAHVRSQDGRTWLAAAPYDDVSSYLLRVSRMGGTIPPDPVEAGVMESDPLLQDYPPRPKNWPRDDPWYPVTIEAPKKFHIDPLTGAGDNDWGELGDPVEHVPNHEMEMARVTQTPEEKMSQYWPSVCRFGAIPTHDVIVNAYKHHIMVKVHYETFNQHTGALTNSSTGYARYAGGRGDFDSQVEVWGEWLHSDPYAYYYSRELQWSNFLFDLNHAGPIGNISLLAKDIVRVTLQADWTVFNLNATPTNKYGGLTHHIMQTDPNRISQADDYHLPPDPYVGGPTVTSSPVQTNVTQYVTTKTVLPPNTGNPLWYGFACATDFGDQLPPRPGYADCINYLYDTTNKFHGGNANVGLKLIVAMRDVPLPG